jgi:arylsulfatase A-like enzyme
VKERLLVRLKRWQRFWCSVLFLSFAIAGISYASAPNLAAANPPNILFILTDDMNLTDVAVMPQLKSQIIDRGINFSNYFVNVSLCCPSRANILRGQYAHNTGIHNNDKILGSFFVFFRRGLERSTIATWLQDKGYRTAHFGKYLNGYPDSAGSTYIPPGWDEWNTPVYGTAYHQFNYTLNQNGTLVDYGDRPEDYGTDVYTRQAKKFITQSAKENQPFFAYVNYYAPHQPATSAPRHRDLFPNAIAPRTPSYNEADVSDKPEYIRNLLPLDESQQNAADALYRKRLRSLQAVDEAIVSLVKTLKDLNILDNTYIFFSSDNGFHLGQHRLPPGKETPYEEDIRLPLFVRGPGIAAGKIVDEIVANVDLALTFAELAKAKTADFVDGRSFAPLLHDRPLEVWRRVLLLEHWPNKREIVRTPEFVGVRTANCTYVEYSNRESELYDLQKDPYQLKNLVSTAKPKILRQFSQRLRQLRLCKEQNCRIIETKPLPSCAEARSS